MHGPGPPAPGEPPPRVVREPLDEDSRPASVAELRSVRRWLLVAAVWAVAATAIAVIALLAANEEPDTQTEDQRSARTARQIDQLQEDLGGRIDELERRLDALPTSDDVSDLDKRLKRVEGGAGRSSDRIEELTGRLDELQQQVDALEEAAAQPDETTTTP